MTLHGGVIMLELYKNIKKYRIESKLTQQELAEKAGYKDKSMIAKIEKGLVDLPQSKIITFADIFEVEPRDLMGYEAYHSGDDGIGNTKLEQFRDSLFFKASKNMSLISNGFHSILNGIYSEVEEIDIEDITYYRLSRADKNIYVELKLLDVIENRTVKYIRNLVDDFGIEDIYMDDFLNAAHERTDIEVTDEMKEHDEAFFDEED